MSISADQIRGARQLLGWSQEKLARQCKIGCGTIADFESGKRTLYPGILNDLRDALEAAGVEFVLGEPGVGLRKARA
jgi:transcriptional regulator with XRE-family HTH domain